MNGGVQGKMRVLVTGGTGFIGSHLCDALIAKGYYVICVDNNFTGTDDNVQHLCNEKQFKVIKHDVVEQLFLDNHIDQVYHLACPASPVHYQFNPIKTIKTNILGTMNMLGLARKHRARFLQASTSEVYGDPLEHPQKESYWGNVNCVGIRACYDEGKRVAETLCFDYHRAHGVDIRVVRIFNTYGPRMAANDGRVVSNFIVQALKGEPLTVYGDGSQTRSFCYVADLVEAMIAMMGQENCIGPVNLGNPCEFTVLELARKVIALTGSSSEIVHKDLPSDDPKQRRPDITLAQERLSWVPRVELEDGLTSTIAYFKTLKDFL